MTKNIKELNKEQIKNLIVDKTNYLSKRGYAITKDQFDSKFLDKLRRELTVMPFTIEDYGAPPNSFPVYLESPKKIYVPKHYAYKNLGIPDTIKMIEPTKINLTFKGSIRANQLEPINIFINSCNLNGDYTPKSLKENSYGGIISLPCGWGKTVIALYLISKLSVKSLIVVHKEFLLNQWKERIQEFLPEAKIGIIQQNLVDVVGKDIVICMLQSISMKEYPHWVFEDFGTVIIDEAHHISSEVFSRALPKLNSKYMLALSATPKRKDKLEKVMEWYIGPYLFVVNQQNTKKVKVNMVHYYNSNPLYSGNETLNNGKPCIARITNNITEFHRRNQIILEILRRIGNEPLTHTLTLSDRREHLRYLYEQITERKICSVGYYVGGMKERDLKDSESKKIMLSTFTMASEALDVNSLNTLVLMTSHSGGSVHTQSCGRILRKSHDEITPTIWDFVDDFSVFKNQALKRLDYYKKQNFEIHKVVIHDDDMVSIENLFQMLDKLELVTYKNKKKSEICVHIDKPIANLCLLNEEEEY